MTTYTPPTGTVYSRPSHAWNSFRVGLFIANRQIRSNLGTTFLVILVMLLTYINLLVVSGLMVGIVEGLRQERVSYQTGAISLFNFSQQDVIQNFQDISTYLQHLPAVAAFSPRLVADGILEANYAGNIGTLNHPDRIVTRIAGIDPALENQTTHLSRLVAEGQYLAPGDYDQILIGTSLLARYKALNANPGSTPLPNVGVGSKILVKVGNVEREMTIKGVMASKLAEITLRSYILDSELRDMLGRTASDVNEVAIALVPGVDAAATQRQLLNAGFGTQARVQSELQSEPAFYSDFEQTFNQLGTILGSIGLIVACIVIFIVVFINTIMRRRAIGILQAIGIQSSGIEIGYVLQSLVYALVGSALGMVVIFMFLQPYFATHPIDFPFSNGTLAISLPEALLKGLILLTAVILASLVPARMIMRQQIVDALLGR